MVTLVSPAALPLASVFARRTPPPLLLGLTALLLAACSPRIATGTLDLVGTSAMNGGGNAALVRVYQLNDDDAFRTVPLEAFWEDGADQLAPALTAEPRELLIYPEQRQQVELALAPTTRYVGVAADLRAPDGDAWRMIYPVLDVVRAPIEVTVGARELSFEVIAAD